ncbi:MAG: hypothetical protein CMF60_00270 [Magnetococcales bacterium]|nr:hypothetical protein [Magnetococcales bacterium]|tara:strand:- start:5816 stop:6235 length:420 start_codon:yes stop_codon:yes gene_type:complete
MPQKTKVTFTSQYFTDTAHIALMESALAKLVDKHPKLVTALSKNQEKPIDNQILVCCSAESAPKLDPNGVAVAETIEGEYYYVFFTVHIPATDEDHVHSDDILPLYLGTAPTGAAPLRLFSNGDGTYRVEDCTGCNCKK